jgi:hypothetical protein
MKRRTVVALVLATALAGLIAPAASAKLPVGEADGVRIIRVKGAIVVVFTPQAAKLYRRIAGRQVSVFCTEAVDQGYHSGGVTQRAPKRRRPIRTGDLTRGLDYCRVSLPPRTIRRDGGRERRGREVIVSIPLTQKGAVLLDEEKGARDLLNLSIFASLAAEELHLDSAPTTAQFLDFIARHNGGVVPKTLVGLATPADTPPAGSIGYYGDGAERTAFVTLSTSGRRLFIETEPDDVLRTNLAQFIFGSLP